MSKLIFGQFYGFPIQKAVAIMLVLLFTWILLKNIMINKVNKERMWKRFNLIITCAMIGIILVLTISSRSGVEELVLVPFYSFIEAQVQPEIYRSMFMNIFLFFPLGLTLPYALPEKWNRNALLTILFALTFSIAIEYLQYHYHLGRAETDDVLCNTLGAFIGTLSYTLSRKFNQK